MLTSQEIQLIRNIRIHQILGIKDDGRKINIKCVFHSDSTPSLLIDSDNKFYCFGCGAKGAGAIDFCMGMGFGFKESLIELNKYIK